MQHLSNRVIPESSAHEDFLPSFGTPKRRGEWNSRLLFSPAHLPGWKTYIIKIYVIIDSWCRQITVRAQVITNHQPTAVEARSWRALGRKGVLLCSQIWSKLTENKAKWPICSGLKLKRRGLGDENSILFYGEPEKESRVNMQGIT